MRDFKSYSSGKKKTGRKLVKLTLLAVFALGAITAFLIFKDRSTDTQTTQPTEPTREPTRDSDRITVPLLLPGQSHEEGRVPSRSNDRPEVMNAPSSDENATVMRTGETPSSRHSPAVIDPPAPSVKRISHTIAKGESLSSIFRQLGLSASLLHKIVHSSDIAGKLTDIKPGQLLHLELNEEHELSSLILEYDKIRSLHVRALESGFSSLEQNRQVEVRTAHVQGTIDNSLYLSAKQAGLSDTLIMQLANIFGWDIDFALEIRSGDRFTVIFEAQYLDGEMLRSGPILAAEFVNQGISYRAVRYEDDSDKADYYTPEGRSMRKAFLRAPVDFRRISSRFSKERWHPVLGRKRPHRGVDYAAGTGTPIKAAGDGKIVHRGWKGGYGNTVIIQHAQSYTTLYGHLSRYHKGAQEGSRVKQGQVIGYVGQSGLATGPHLHYEFRVNGVHRNPLTVKLPDARPIAAKYQADFLLQTAPLIAQLDTLHRILVADAR